jgi:hypothetical protein
LNFKAPIAAHLDIGIAIKLEIMTLNIISYVSRVSNLDEKSV